LRLYNINFKENDDLMMFYYDQENTVNDDIKSYFAKYLESFCKSCIIDKNNLKTIASQYNKILSNESTLSALSKNKWENVVVSKSYEGTMILVFYHNNNWYITTRRCIDAKNSVWVAKTSYYDLFHDVIKDKFELDDLDKNYCYHFVLIHPNNKNIVSYNVNYKDIIHILTTEKYTLKEIDYVINDKVRKNQYEKFDSLKDLMSSLKQINDNDKMLQKVTFEGYILKIYTNDNNFIVGKIQTELYEYLSNMKPNNSNNAQIYLELYQKDKLSEYLPFIADNNHRIISKRIHETMKTMTTEIFNIYHETRNTNNKELYDLLQIEQKKTLYGLHGLYIKKKQSNDIKKSITVHDVYNFLKNIEPNKLRKLFYERKRLFDGKIKTNDNTNTIRDCTIAYDFFNKNCEYTMLQCELMFD
jgi:hypothetical protein